jgi:hypothetical protein
MNSRQPSSPSDHSPPAVPLALIRRLTIAGAKIPAFALERVVELVEGVAEQYHPTSNATVARPLIPPPPAFKVSMMFPPGETGTS